MSILQMGKKRNGEIRNLAKISWLYMGVPTLKSQPLTMPLTTSWCRGSIVVMMKRVLRYYLLLFGLGDCNTDSFLVLILLELYLDYQTRNCLMSCLSLALYSVQMFPSTALTVIFITTLGHSFYYLWPSDKAREALCGHSQQVGQSQAHSEGCRLQFLVLLSHLSNIMNLYICQLWV